MKAIANYFAFAALIGGLSGFAAAPALAAKGKDFPGTTCTCQGCETGGGDTTGDCATVCKDKTVYSKGSNPHDYCKATGITPTGNTLSAALALGGLTAAEVAKESKVSPSTLNSMLSSGHKPVAAKAETVKRVIYALEVRGVEITEDGVRLAQKPLPSKK